MEARVLKKKKAKGGHMQHGHTQWRVPTAPVAAKPAKKPKEEPKPAVGTSSLCASHSPALSNPSVPAVQGAPLGKRPAARADSEPLKKQKKKVPKTNGAPAKSESSRPATGYTAAPIAPAAPAAQVPLAARAPVQSAPAPRDRVAAPRRALRADGERTLQASRRGCCLRHGFDGEPAARG